MQRAAACLRQELGLDPDTARLEAQLLAAHALGVDRAWLVAHGEQAPDSGQHQTLTALLHRRRAGEPMAYLLGRREFYGMELHVSPAVLIPRPETELLVELALARLPTERPGRILDLGTGSGAIALALARARPLATIVAVDRSAAALAVARANAQRLAPARVDFVLGDWYAPLGDQDFDLIVANPPYVAADDPHLQQGDLRFEPREALAAGADGLDALRVIIAGAPAHLRAGGWLLVEHGHEQGAACCALLAQAGFEDIGTWTDLAGLPRVSGGALPRG
ncbi:MAG: peptide chain release factor N(5)-glutamine methyltransferase [Thiobacillaceae bacterium]|nr:peptide chain release factor N(5)-glutamine methyltransferase [Thiobacillaceae bacterium]